MKYEKATVTIFDLGEDEVIATSGCATSGFIAGENCGTQNQYDKFAKCTNNGHLLHGGQ